VVVGEDLALTGMLHLDGLADSADGLLAQLPPERRLAVMSEPQVGAFGVVSVAIALLLRVAALSGAATGAVWQAVLLLGAVWATARSMMVLAMATIPYARQHGMATAFVSGRPAEPLAQRATVPTVATLSAVVFGLAGGAFAIASSRHLSEGAVILAGVLSASLVLFLASRRIGGYTGDVLGAAGVVAETVGLLVAAGKW
jgi:adenosylcobinamide-GDP ribazoletransferase